MLLGKTVFEEKINFVSNRKILVEHQKKERCSPNHETNPTETQIYFFLPKTNINR